MELHSRMKKFGFFGWLIIAVVLLLVFSSWWKPKVEEKKIERQSEMTSRETALLCTTDMATQYHIHPELHILIDGVENPIPPNLGIQSTCMTSIHTHEGGGIIHVESPVQKDFTLGDFFAVWKKAFSKDKVLDSMVTPTTEIVVTVNGTRVDTYENTILKDKDKIVISYQNK